MKSRESRARLQKSSDQPNEKQIVQNLSSKSSAKPNQRPHPAQKSRSVKDRTQLKSSRKKIKIIQRTRKETNRENQRQENSSSDLSKKFDLSMFKKAENKHSVRVVTNDSRPNFEMNEQGNMMNFNLNGQIDLKTEAKKSKKRGNDSSTNTGQMRSQPKRRIRGKVPSSSSKRTRKTLKGNENLKRKKESDYKKNVVVSERVQPTSISSKKKGKRIQAIEDSEMYEDSGEYEIQNRDVEPKLSPKNSNYPDNREISENFWKGANENSHDSKLRGGEGAALSDVQAQDDKPLPEKPVSVSGSKNKKIKDNGKLLNRVKPVEKTTKSKMSKEKEDCFRNGEDGDDNQQNSKQVEHRPRTRSQSALSSQSSNKNPPREEREGDLAKNSKRSQKIVTKEARTITSETASNQADIVEQTAVEFKTVDSPSTKIIEEEDPVTTSPNKPQPLRRYSTRSKTRMMKKSQKKESAVDPSNIGVERSSEPENEALQAETKTTPTKAKLRPKTHKNQKKLSKKKAVIQELQKLIDFQSESIVMKTASNQVSAPQTEALETAETIVELSKASKKKKSPKSKKSSKSKKSKKKKSKKRKKLELKKRKNIQSRWNLSELCLAYICSEFLKMPIQEIPGVLKQKTQKMIEDKLSVDFKDILLTCLIPEALETFKNEFLVKLKEILSDLSSSESEAESDQTAKDSINEALIAYFETKKYQIFKKIANCAKPGGMDEKRLKEWKEISKAIKLGRINSAFKAPTPDIEAIELKKHSRMLAQILLKGGGEERSKKAGSLFRRPRKRKLPWGGLSQRIQRESDLAVSVDSDLIAGLFEKPVDADGAVLGKRGQACVVDGQKDANLEQGGLLAASDEPSGFYLLTNLFHQIQTQSKFQGPKSDPKKLKLK